MGISEPTKDVLGSSHGPTPPLTCSDLLRAETQWLRGVLRLQSADRLLRVAATARVLHGVVLLAVACTEQLPCTHN